jgi:hypothetical protein
MLTDGAFFMNRNKPLSFFLFKGGYMLDSLKKWFMINLSDYENINFSLEINKVVLGACIALMLGIIFLNVYRSNMRLMIMQLTRRKATCEENAKTLKEMGLADSYVIKRLLTGNNTLTKIVARVGAAEYDYETYKAMSKEERLEAYEKKFGTEEQWDIDTVLEFKRLKDKNMFDVSEKSEVFIIEQTK